MSATETIRLSRTEVRGTAGDVLEIPRQLGSVRLLHQIGQGGMGVVWLGRDDMLGREVAVKFLLGAIASEEDPEFATFLEGARAAAALRHPGLTVIHQAGLVEKIPYIVMEYIDGPTLAAVLRTCPDPHGLTLPAALSAFDSACTAIGELHDRGIIHRDIKPANILFDHDARLVVTDFGLACSRPLTSLGSAAAASGTPAYMAPEMFDGAISTRSDVYALGGMLFELLTGNLLFEGPPDAVRRAHREEAPPLDRLRQREIPEPVVLLVQRALHKEPIYRHRSAAHLQHALHEAVPDATLFSRGRHQLPALIARALGHAADTDAPSSTQTYYETIGERAARKRTIGPPPPLTPAAPALPRPPTPERVPPQAPAAEPAPPPAPSPSPAQPESWASRIIINLPCARCAYNLRGVPEQAACPECGEPMAASLRPDRLLFAPARWLRRTRLGASIYLGLAATVLISAPLAVIVIGLVTLNNGNAFKGSIAIALLAVGVLIQAGVLLSTILMTLPEPGAPKRHRFPWALLACMAAVAIPALYWAGAALQAAGHPRLGGALVTAASASVFVWMGALGTYLASLAHRIPDRRLAARSGALLPAAGLLLFIAAVALVLGLFAPTKADAKVDDVLGGIIFWKVAVDMVVLLSAAAGMIYIVYIAYAASRQLRWMHSLCTPRDRAVGAPAA